MANYNINGYEEKLNIFNANFSLGTCDNLFDKLEMISLMCVIVYAYKKKDASIKVIDVVKKTIPDFGEILCEELSIICESLCNSSKTSSKFQYTNVEEIVKRIRELGNKILPF